MPPRKKKEGSVLERVHKESKECTKLIREEFDRIERDLTERYHLENASGRVNALQRIMYIKFQVLRNRMYNEMDMITGEYVSAVQEVEKEHGRRQRGKGTSERLASSSGPRATTGKGKGKGQKHDIGKDDESQDSGRTVSQITGDSTRKRTRIDNSADEVQNQNNQTAVASAAGIVPVSALVSIVVSGAGAATVSDANEAPDSSPGPAATSAPDSGMRSVVDSAMGPAADSVGESAAASIVRPVTRSLVGSAADSGAGSMDPSAAQKSDHSNREDAVVVRNIHSTASQPEQTEIVFKNGQRAIRIMGPTPPISHGTHDFAGHNADREIHPDVLISEHEKVRKKKKKKSKATKKPSLFREIFETDPSDDSNENNESAISGEKKKKSKKKEGKPMSTPPEVVEVDLNDVNNSNEDATAEGKKAGQKTVKENQPTSDDVVEVLSSADEIEPNEPQIVEKDDSTSDDRKNIEEENEVEEVEPTAKPATTRRKKTSPIPEDPSPADTEQRAPEAAARRSTRTRKPSQRKLQAKANQRGSRRN